MPIKTENKHRYPSNWREIRAAILERAGDRCEQCGIPNRAWRNNATGQRTKDAGLAVAWLCRADHHASVLRAGTRGCVRNPRGG